MPHAPPDMFTDLCITHSVWIVRHCRLLWSTTAFIIIHVSLTAHAFRCLCVRHHQPFCALWQQQVRGRQWYWRKYERPNTFCRRQSTNYYNGSCILWQCKLLKKLIMLFSPDTFQFLSPSPCTIFFTNLSLYSFLKTRDKVSSLSNSYTLRRGTFSPIRVCINQPTTRSRWKFTICTCTMIIHCIGFLYIHFSDLKMAHSGWNMSLSE